MLTKVADDESPNMFSCENCDYKTCRKSSFDKHLLTAKHNYLTEMITNDNKKTPEYAIKKHFTFFLLNRLKNN